MVKMLKYAKKGKIVTLSFPKFVSYHHLNVQEELRIRKYSLQYCLYGINWQQKRSFLSLLKTKKDKKQQTNKVGFLNRKKTPL